MKNITKSFWITAFSAAMIMIFLACGNTTGSNLGSPDSPGSPGTIFYTVTFDSDEGSVVPSQEVSEGGKAVEPGYVVKIITGLHRGASAEGGLLGWYNGETKWDFNTVVTEDITLKARYTSPIDLSGADGENIVEKAVSYINNNPVDEGYILVLDKNTAIKPQVLESHNFKLTVAGLNGEKTISLANGSSGTLFALGKNNSSVSVEFTLGKNITLKGKTGNNDAVITVNSSNAHFYMLSGSKITENSIYLTGSELVKDQINTAAAVEIKNGKMTMKGGLITGNTSTKIIKEAGFFQTPSAVAIHLTGALNMEGGSITGNTGAAAEIAYFVGPEITNPGFFSLSGNAEIGSVVMVSDNIWSQRGIKIASSWNPDRKVVLHLSGNEGTMEYIPSRFKNGPVLDASAAAIGKFELGNFYGASLSTDWNNEQISPEYWISAVTGRLTDK